MLNKIISRNIKVIRERSGLSQQKLALKSNLTVRYISRLENSAPNITVDVLERLARGLDCSPDEIVCVDGEIPKKGLDKKHLAAIENAIELLQELKRRIK